MTINTPNGPIEIITAPPEILSTLQSLTPFGIEHLKEPFNGAHYGLVMAKGGKEVMCLKQQSIERPKQDAEMQFQLTHYMIVEAYTRHRAHHFSGAYLASPYLRQRDNGLWESGIGHFIFPSPDGPEVEADAKLSTYDTHFGKGATTMLTRFIFDMRECYKDKPFKEPPTIGLDLRPRSHLTFLAMYFMLLGSQVICLRANLREEDPAWGVLAKAGIREVLHLPCVPLDIRD
jgi:hypothetical protein